MRVFEKRRRDPLTYLLNGARHREKVRGRSVNMATGDIYCIDVQGEYFCAYCLQKCVTGTQNKPEHNSISLDRIDPARHYVPGNVALACFECNRRKSWLSAEQLKQFSLVIADVAQAAAS